MVNKMKRKIFIIAIIILFLIMNTSYFWEKEVGVLLIPILLVLAVCFLVLIIKFFFELNTARKEKFRNKARVYVLLLLFIVLTTSILFPQGLINFDKLEGKDLLVAYREGAASCTTTLKLKDNNKFKITSICFGIEERSGKYELRNDTLYFKEQTHRDRNIKQYKFGILKGIDSVNHSNLEKVEGVTLYVDYGDTIGFSLKVLAKKTD
jgi:Cbb3-type cytochrome oxidase, cytochrome c subunit